MKKLSKFSILALIFSLCLNLSVGGFVNALTPNPSTDKTKEKQEKLEKDREHWKNNPLTQEQTDELSKALSKENVLKALEKLDKEGKEGIETVKLSDNFSMKITTTVETDKISNANLFKSVQAATYRKSVTKTWEVESITGITVYDFTLYGDFNYDYSTCQALGAVATGNSRYFTWAKDSSSSSYYSNTATGNWTFKNYLGYAPIGMSIDQDDWAAKIVMSANGTFTTSCW